jgi:hypothetical protein
MSMHPSYRGGSGGHGMANTSTLSLPPEAMAQMENVFWFHRNCAHYLQMSYGEAQNMCMTMNGMTRQQAQQAIFDEISRRSQFMPPPPPSLPDGRPQTAPVQSTLSHPVPYEQPPARLHVMQYPPGIAERQWQDHVTNDVERMQAHMRGMQLVPREYSKRRMSDPYEVMHDGYNPYNEDPRKMTRTQSQYPWWQ